MTLKGAIAAGEFNDDGDFVSFAGKIDDDSAGAIARMCAAHSMMGASHCSTFAKVSNMNWLPFKGWAIFGGDYSIFITGNYGVLLRSEFADFNEVNAMIQKTNES